MPIKRSIKQAIKILTISSKGGVGKSTIAMQIVTPYLYQHNNNKPVQYYEFDDENKDYLSFGASTLSIRNTVDVSDDYVREEITDIFSKNESVCVDIGGNKTTTLALKAFIESGMIHLIDLVIIPLLDGEQDGINATQIYTSLKKSSPDIKILFILNKVKSIKKLAYQFENFFADPRGIFSDKYAVKTHLHKNDINNYVCLMDDDVIKYSRRFGLTIYEIAKQERDFITDLRNNITSHDSNKESDEKEIKLLSFKSYMDISSKAYFEEVISPIFNKIDQLLAVKKSPPRKKRTTK